MKRTVGHSKCCRPKRKPTLITRTEYADKKKLAVMKDIEQSYGLPIAMLEKCLIVY